MKKGLALLLVIGLIFTASSASFSQQESNTINMFTKIATGWGYVVAVKNDGTLWGWGANFSGQLGNGDNTFASPACIGGIADVKAVSAGGEFTVVLKNDGTVWACGSNKYGQLGIDPAKGIKSSEWVRCSDLTDIVAIASGKNHVVALKSDGTVWTWGRNYSGQLGDGKRVDRFVPAVIKDLSGITAISAGSEHTAALKSDGTVWVWGNDFNLPLDDVITYGYYFTGSDDVGTVMWENKKNIVPDSSLKLSPVCIEGLQKVKVIAAGGDHTLVLKKDGTVWSWGENSEGQLDNGNRATSATPNQVKEIKDVTAIAAGGNTSIAIKTDGSVWTWGSSLSKVINAGPGNAGNDGINRLPVQVTGISNVAAISPCISCAVAVTEDGSVWTWGGSSSGQLGVADLTTSDTPKMIPDFSLIVKPKEISISEINAIDELQDLIKNNPTRDEAYDKAAELFTLNKDASIKVFLDGELLDFSKYNNALPQIIANRTLVPVTAIAEGLGADVKYDASSKLITISMKDKTIRLTVDANVAYINDNKIILDSSAIIINDRTFVPLSFIANSFGKTVKWHPYKNGNGAKVIAIY